MAPKSELMTYIGVAPGNEHNFLFMHSTNAVFVEVTHAPSINCRRSAHKTATHISVDLVIVLFRVDVTCHMSHITVTCHNVCYI